MVLGLRELAQPHLWSFAQHGKSRERAFKVQLCFPIIYYNMFSFHNSSSKCSYTETYQSTKTYIYEFLHDTKSLLMHLLPAMEQSLLD